MARNRDKFSSKICHTMIVAIISFVLCIVGVSFSSTDYNGFKKKVEFCNDHPSQVRLFLRVKYQEVEYAMFVDIISAHRCEKLDAVVNGKYLLRSSTFDRTSFMSTVCEVFVNGVVCLRLSNNSCGLCIGNGCATTVFVSIWRI